ncbi:FkbM family methyltransferase [Haloechinothrix sp. LS1_15]|uniref:FkbM family methyltransferase n=1 Tax=Haloechinothrix sp. LS1_15 TaxID=2652248 RepID=UPI0029485321|nr:FkbM family methyltransferase [Haloechinothrix sp. LS1_15]MDV6014550.1 FkbM family methyltransferase [Haloechinothrix sp. LS1_15]
MPDTPAVTACTVVARNYLPAATVLARSYLAHHPGHDFVIAVIDGGRRPAGTTPQYDHNGHSRHSTNSDHGGHSGTSGHNGYRIVGPEAFDIDEQDYLRMATAYTVIELATAVKPFLLRALRKERDQHDVVLYLDPDIQVFAPLDEITELAGESSLVLTPHHLEPLPRDGKSPDEAAIMGSGVFNLGFVATGPGSEGFLDFWAARLRHDAIVAPEQQLFTDQRWVDQVPALFRHAILTDPGYNVAYWNLHERPLGSDGGELTARGHPLRFFHFSGYRPEQPWMLSRHCPRDPRILLSEHPLLKGLCDDYAAALRTAGYRESSNAVPYTFDTFGDGTPISVTMRRLYRSAWIAAERTGDPPPPHAFGSDGGRALQDWLTTPADAAQRAAGLHRLALSVWHSRADLRAAFPDPYGVHAEGFRYWCATSGVAENVLAEWAAPAARPEISAPEAGLGVNLAGYLTAALGVGELGRLVRHALDEAGIDVTPVIERPQAPHQPTVNRSPATARARFPVTLLAINADQTRHVLYNNPELAHDRYVIGLWSWELDEFPPDQHVAFEHVDEIWTISEFCRRAIAEHAPVAVRTLPVPVRDPGQVSYRERDPAAPTRFLFTFDFNSVAERKNPWAVVTAFREAFARTANARLVIKASNAAAHPHSAERLRLHIADDERIELIESHLDDAALDALYRDSDCYVSLHRSEGFGLTVAEAMIRGLPVIATDYGGTAEFITPACGWPIDYRLVPVGEGNHPYPPQAMWAEPDLDAAAAAMRQVAEDPVGARERGAAAREHIRRTSSTAGTARWLRAELDRVYAAWRERMRAAAETGPPDPMRPLLDSREALRWRPDPTSPSRLPMAPALRKLVTRAVDHYDVHQRSVMGELVDGVEGTVRRLLERVEALEGRQRETTDALANLVRDEVRRVTGTEQRRTADRIESVRRELADVDSWCARTGEAFEALRHDLGQLRDRVDDIPDRAALDELASRIDGQAARIDEHARRTHAMFAERDTRADQHEQAIDRTEHDLNALRQAARLLHSPVPDGADVVICDAGALLLPVDEVMWDWINHHRCWEPEEAELISRLTRLRGGTFLDVGAHVGYHTLRLAQACAGAVTTVAVEVDRTNFAFLERNIAVNLPAAAAERVTALRLAAWDTDGQVELVSRGDANSGDHRVVPARQQPHTPVPAARLDSRPEVTAAPVGVVKLDLQGRDHRALAGLASVVERDRPDIICEFCPEAITELGDDPVKVLAGYRALGYLPTMVGDAADGPAPAGNGTGVDSTLTVDAPWREAPDAEVIRRAREAETGYRTLWLRPRD